MSEATPHFAPFVVLLFLGALFVTGVSILVLLYGSVRRSKLIAKIGAAGTLIILAGYGLLLCGVSLASSEKVLPVGGWKYFCEIDCHIGYSVSDVETTAALGPEMQPVSAQGRFVIVRVKVWFDEQTISPTRGDGLLTPNPRRVVLVDASGRTYTRSSVGEAALARVKGEEMTLRRPLRPGQSFEKDLVFDVPKHTSGLRLLITEDDPETRLIIGHENSLLHKKIYLSLNAAPSITSEISSLAPNK
ncbi:MAG TPA: hypothetical protein VNH65_01890 [Candidatus Acidoferrum sp.]|nr:hypothetical protein [Candidatus Acidoferrum sp.]